MSRSAIETILGAIVLFIAVAFLLVAFSTTDIQTVEGYTVTADFSQSNGLIIGGDIRISGVKVGTIRDIKLDPETYLATVVMTIAPEYQLPDDTVAKIQSESLLGGNYLALEPGGSMDTIPDNGKIQYTQASVSLEDMIGKLIFAMSGSDEDKKDTPTSETQTDTP